MKTRSEVLKIAESFLGDGGSVFRKFAGLPAGTAYCNAYVDYVAYKGGVSSLYFNGRKETYCPHSIEWCKKNLAQIPPYLALPMDIIYIDWERNGIPNHIGLVRARKSTSTIYTIEGNTDKKDKKGRTVAKNVVANRTRSMEYVQGIYRTLYPSSVKLSKVRLDETNTEVGYVTIYNLQLALGMKATGILTKETVKVLQRKVEATVDGAWGPGTSRKIQKKIGAKIDGEFGPDSVRKWKKWINKINYPSSVKKPAETKPASQTKAPVKKTYSGTLPTLNTNAKIINSMAFHQCWPYGTKQSKYTYKKGKPLAAYTKGIDKAYPKHKSWPNKKQRVGACCDVFVGECCGNVGVPVPKDLKNQLKKMPKMTSKLTVTKNYKASQFKAGDIVARGRKDYSGHTLVIAVVYKVKNGKIVGTKYVANSHYKTLGGTYAVMDSKSVTQKPSKWRYYYSYRVKGAIRTWYGIGDYGVDVYRIQAFLKWAGFYKGALDFVFGLKTADAVSAFQKALGWKPVGRCGTDTIKAMKTWKK